MVEESILMLSVASSGSGSTILVQRYGNTRSYCYPSTGSVSLDRYQSESFSAGPWSAIAEVGAPSSTDSNGTVYSTYPRSASATQGSAGNGQ